jgi:hypothetical protein
MPPGVRLAEQSLLLGVRPAASRHEDNGPIWFQPFQVNKSTEAHGTGLCFRNGCQALRTAWLKHAMGFFENSDAVIEVVDDIHTERQIKLRIA